MLAGKTTIGTLDTQDYLLCNMTDGDNGLAFGDFRRGQDLYDLGAYKKLKWQELKLRRGCPSSRC
jgi:hypothetical protein